MTLLSKHSSAPSSETLLIPNGNRPDHLKGRFGTRTLFLDRLIPPPLKKHPFIFWIAIGFILSCVAVFLSFKTSNPRAYAQMCMLQIIGFVAVPSAIRACRLLILDWNNNAKKFVVGTRLHKTAVDIWLDRELSNFEGSPIMLLGGSALAILALAGFSFDDYPVGIGSAATLYSSFIVAASAFAAGVGLCAMAYGTRTVWRFGNSFHISVQNHKFGVLSTGSMLLQCCVLVTLTWSAYTSSAIFGVMGSSVATFSIKNPIWLLAAPSAALVLVSFIVCQIPLHKRMIEYKRDQLMAIEKILEELKDYEPRLLTAEVLGKIAFFENRRSQIMSLPEWPFAFAALLGSISSASMVILTTLLSSYVKAAWALP
jgi:hypothetical protein